MSHTHKERKILVVAALAAIIFGGAATQSLESGGGLSPDAFLAQMMAPTSTMPVIPPCAPDVPCAQGSTSSWSADPSMQKEMMPTPTMAPPTAPIAMPMPTMVDTMPTMPAPTTMPTPTPAPIAMPMPTMVDTMQTSSIAMPEVAMPMPTPTPIDMKAPVQGVSSSIATMPVMPITAEETTHAAAGETESRGFFSIVWDSLTAPFTWIFGN